MQRILIPILLAPVFATCAEKRAVAEIVAEIEKADAVARQRLVPELRALGKDAAAGWIQLLKKSPKDYNLHVLATSELGSLGGEAAVAVPDLVRFLREGFPGMNAESMTAAERVRTPDAGRKPAREALRAIGASAVAPVRALLTHEKGRARQEAALTLGQIGAAAAPAVPDLIRALGDKDKAVAASAAWSLGEIRQVSEAVKQALVAAFGDVEPLVRFESLRAVGKFGKEAAELREDVRRLTGDADTGVRQIAVEVLERLPLPMSTKKDAAPPDRKKSK